MLNPSKRPEVKLYDAGPKAILARIPYELKDKPVAYGYFKKSQKLWEYPYTGYAAYNLIAPLREHITHCDFGVKELAESYLRCHQRKKATDLPAPEIKNLKATLWAHQITAHYFARDLHGTALLMDMATGKTLTAISLIMAREHGRNLIICPKSVLDVWKDEFRKHLDEELVITAPLKKTIKDRAREAHKQMELAKVKKKPFVLLINYEAFWRTAFASFLQSVEWHNVIYDECHKLKDPTSNTSKFAHKLIGNSLYRLGLTGTFMPKDPLDPFSQYKAIDWSVFGGSYYRYKLRFAEMGGYGGYEIQQFINQDELHQKIEAIAIQVTNEALDLPEEIHTFRSCELNTQTRRIYDEMDSDLYAAVESGEITIDNAMVKILRLQQLTSGHIKTDEGDVVEYGLEKRDLLAELLSEIPKEEPVVVFARFTKDIENIRAAAEAQNRSTGELTGKANQLRAFQDGEFNVLAVQVRAGSLGIDLTRACYCVFYSIGHSLGDFKQAVKRVNRPGQTRAVRYYHLLASGTVDERVYDALQNKEEVVNYVLRGIRQELPEKQKEAV